MVRVVIEIEVHKIYLALLRAYIYPPPYTHAHAISSLSTNVLYIPFLYVFTCAFYVHTNTVQARAEDFGACLQRCACCDTFPRGEHVSGVRPVQYCGGRPVSSAQSE